MQPTRWPSWKSLSEIWKDKLHICFQLPDQSLPIPDPIASMNLNCPPVPGCIKCLDLANAGAYTKIPESQRLMELYNIIYPIFQQLPLNIVDRAEPIINFNVVDREHFFSLLRSFTLHNPKSLSLRNALLKQFENLEVNKKISITVVEQLLETINAIDLELRLPDLKTKTVEKGKSATISFHDILAVNLNGLKQGGDLSLRVESGLPCYTNSFNVGWPVAHYVLNFNGILDQNGYVNLEFYLNRFGFDYPISRLRVLEWNGKSCVDVTTAVDVNGRIIRARTKKLSS